MPDRISNIESDLLIVGEGTGDASLIKYLARERGITGFQVEDSGGSTKFQRFIEGLNARPGYSGLKGLVVIGDSDQGVDDSFKNIRTQLKAAKVQSIPGTPFRVADSHQGTFATYVAMLPFTGSGDNITPLTGALETVILPSVMDKFPDIAKCTDQWRDCARIDDWKIAHRDKARLRALISAVYPDDPNISLTWALRPESKIVPLNHACFDPLAELLKSLRGIMGL